MKNFFNNSKNQEIRHLSNDSTKKKNNQDNSFQDNSEEAIQMLQFQSSIQNSDEVKQMMAYDNAVQKYENTQLLEQDAPQKKNNTGLPDNLKTGMENLSGMSLDDVMVHRNSDKPAQLQAHAFAQGTDIHLAPGQEKHLGHEAWHVVQQKQGKVKPTIQMKGDVNINDDKRLEKEADIMGAKALQMKSREKKGESEKHTSQQSTLQLAGGRNAFQAGEGAYWHVHYDHVKFGNDNATRVNFEGRTAKQIRKKLKEVKDRSPKSDKGSLTYHQCINYIDKYIE